MATYSAKIALLGNLVDYAGTFPPAALPLEKAMAEVCAFRRRAAHPWLLARIVVTIADLKKLSPKAWFEAGSDGTPLPMTVIGSATEHAADLGRNVGFEMREARRFNEKFLESSLRQKVFAYESKLPDDCATQSIADTLKQALDAGLQGDSLGMDVFFEIPLQSDWQSRLAAATRAMADWMENRQSAVGAPGIKTRTGGKTPPSPEQLAEVVAATVSHAMKFKATQGLHHPFTHGSEYGFVNLFGALAFAQSLGLEVFGPEHIAACLKADESELTLAKTLKWKKFELEPEQIEAARRQYGGTFGSCSIAEPDEFLSKGLK